MRYLTIATLLLLGASWAVTVPPAVASTSTDFFSVTDFGDGTPPPLCIPGHGPCHDDDD